MTLDLLNVRKRFDQTDIIKHITFTFENGIYGLLGANGAGKTTLMKCICNLYKLSEGCIQYNGVDIQKMDEAYRDILGYLPQDFGFYPDYTALNFLIYIGCLKGLSAKLARNRALEVLKDVDLYENRNKKLKKYSGGMLRRIGIAQALINRPKVLILDEPTAGLDPKERIRLRNIISRFSSEHIVIISTHIVSDIEYIANTILIQKDGDIIKVGTREELLEEINDCVWEGEVAMENIETYEKNYVISNLKTDQNRCNIRLISKHKLKGFHPVKPTLDDLYLSLFEEGVYECNDQD